MIGINVWNKSINYNNFSLLISQTPTPKCSTLRRRKSSQRKWSTKPCRFLLFLQVWLPKPIRTNKLFRSLKTFLVTRSLIGKQLRGPHSRPWCFRIQVIIGRLYGVQWFCDPNFNKKKFFNKNLFQVTVHMSSNMIFSIHHLTEVTILTQH